MTTPRIVFCTTCKGRSQHLEQTLPKNLADNAGYANAKFVILDYNSQDNLVPYLAQNHWKDVTSGRLVFYRHPAAGPFRMAHAKNMAHRLGILEGADILVNLDADNFTGEGFASYVAEQFQPGGVFLWAKMVQEGMDRLPRGCNGRIAVSSQAFLNAGGYDEKYATWAPDDKDFNARLQRLGYVGVEIDRRYLCDVVVHSNKMRFKEYPHARCSMGSNEFELGESETTVVNFGSFGCGTVFRNLDLLPMELGPLPTRIFGIGLHKTATTSLHSALKLMGFDSAHWKSAHWAKTVWLETTTLGRSLALEKHYALSDLPIPILYEKLDKAYPGSKFILTTRDEIDWLRSVKRHWSHDHNRFREGWNHDPFTHRIHREVYGQKGFDAEKFLARYRRHNAEVMEYFKNRPGDLLIMDMERGDGWDKLCGFLGKPVPQVEYPRAFATREK